MEIFDVIEEMDIFELMENMDVFTLEKFKNDCITMSIKREKSDFVPSDLEYVCKKYLINLHVDDFRVLKNKYSMNKDTLTKYIKFLKEKYDYYCEVSFDNEDNLESLDFNFALRFGSFISRELKFYYETYFELCQNEIKYNLDL